ncbi:MAG: peptide deformylase [Oscillospiraceae bacterium]|nr:peptide deformylase [Oscillospiraceae bacterium]
MAIRIIREYGDEILKKKSKPVEVVNNKIRELIQDMKDTMHKFNGLGLAAPQVGVLKRILVIDLYEEDFECLVLVNPVIEKQQGKQTVDEGCLSFPNQFGKVERPEKVTVKGLNEFGEKIKIVATGILAQAICHEVDHLEGQLFIDKIIPGTFEIIKPEDVEKKEI